MRLAIYGTGGAGGFFGAHLARSGEDVVFIARGEHLRAIHDEGLYVETPGGDIRIHPAQATDDPAKAGEVDVVLLGVKAWQVLDAAVTATKSLDDKVLAEWLRKNKVDTIQGKLRFDGTSNYGDDLMSVKQVQNGRWVTVWPKSVAAPGATLMTK